MTDKFIDYRNDTLGGTRDIRVRLKMASSGKTISFVCREDQVVKLLREITFQDGTIISRTSTEEGVFITVRKTG
ncbi:MAG: hypothetical protein JRE18_04980 [Deltaproteobacteria bacterium]|jgi:hypothetical protein|nr:hypothetical protein [Deltaproteobacteria bacterium]